jgi:dynein heavy chain, axonemal
VTLSGERYDHQTDQETLPQRDLHDKKVAEVARKLLGSIDGQFDLRIIQARYPVKYKAPLNNIVNRELTAYKRLLEAIRASVEDLLANIDGKHPRPLEVEALWQSVSRNSVPDAWRKVSFPTARDSLADFLVELCLRLKYWRRLVDGGSEGTPTYWLRAFYDPRALLRALIQTRARSEGIPFAELRNEFEVLEQPAESEEASREQHVAYLQGLALEGAEWHGGDRQLVEVATPARFSSFPGLRVRTVRLP